MREISKLVIKIGKFLLKSFYGVFFRSRIFEFITDRDTSVCFARQPLSPLKGRIGERIAERTVAKISVNWRELDLQ